jgi:hypothetical protein
LRRGAREDCPSRPIDYRAYLRLLADFQERGGDFRAGQQVSPEEIARLSERHDLVVATGKGGTSAMFPAIAGKSPYGRPQRRLCAGLYHGIAQTEPKGVTMSIAPPHGELLEIPTFSASGHVTVLLFENVPGGDTEVLADAKYDEDPAAFERLVLDKLRAHHPQVFERVDPARFGLTRPEDLLQGAVKPGGRGRVHRQLQPAGAPVGHPGDPRAHERVPGASRDVAARTGRRDGDTEYHPGGGMTPAIPARHGGDGIR